MSPPEARSLALAAALVGALFVVDRLAVRAAPSDAELVETVRSEAGSIAARRALFGLVLREVEAGRPSAALDIALADMGPAEKAFLAAYRPDLLQRGGER